MSETNLLIFNLKTDADDDVLGFTTDWINSLAGEFNQVYVVSMEVGRIDVADNVEVFSLGKEKGYSKARRAFELYKILWGLVAARKVHACFCHMTPLFAIMAWPILRMQRIPIFLWYAHKSVTLILRIAVQLVDRVLTSSATGFQLRSKKTRIIGQGIDTQRFSPIARTSRLSKEFHILTVGRLSPIKRADVLLHAASILAQRRPGMSFKVLIVGKALTPRDSEYERALLELVKKLQIEEKVQFLGARPYREIHQFYVQADCFVNLGETESVDKTVLEAMSCGVPIITSNIAFYEILDPQLASEWLIERERIDLLCDRLISIHDMTSAERSLLGEKLRRIVLESHSLANLTRRICEQIEEIS